MGKCGPRTDSGEYAAKTLTFENDLLPGLAPNSYPGEGFEVRIETTAPSQSSRSVCAGSIRAIRSVGTVPAISATNARIKTTETIVGAS